jgi:hypothetical protein
MHEKWRVFGRRYEGPPDRDGAVAIGVEAM